MGRGRTGVRRRVPWPPRRVPLALSPGALASRWAPRPPAGRPAPLGVPASRQGPRRLAGCRSSRPAAWFCRWAGRRVFVGRCVVSWAGAVRACRRALRALRALRGRPASALRPAGRGGPGRAGATRGGGRGSPQVGPRSDWAPLMPVRRCLPGPGCAGPRVRRAQGALGPGCVGPGRRRAGVPPAPDHPRPRITPGPGPPAARTTPGPPPAARVPRAGPGRRGGGRRSVGGRWGGRPRRCPPGPMPPAAG